MPVAEVQLDWRRLARIRWPMFGSSTTSLRANLPTFGLTRKPVRSPTRRFMLCRLTRRSLTRCMLMTTDPGDLVLDPTCGSGTTAYVAEQWGRRWITMDTSRVAVALARQRLLTAKYDFFKLKNENTTRDGDFVTRRFRISRLRILPRTPISIQSLRNTSRSRMLSSPPRMLP